MTTVSSTFFSLGMRTQENVYYTVNLFFSSAAREGACTFLLCCVITGNFIFTVFAVGGEQFTDVRKRGTQHDS